MRRLAAFLFLSLVGCHAEPRPEAQRAAILGVLDAQADAWNAGDIAAFMARGYVESEELVFTSGGVVQRGYAATLARYQAKYADRKSMGRLEFSEVEVTLTGPKSAVALGRWALARDEGPVGGVFSLVFVQRDGRWRILHDHTSVSRPD